MGEILIVDPDPFTSKLLQFVLEQAGYIPRAAVDSASALALINQRMPSMALIDIDLPKVSGFDLCREIRRNSDVPIIFVTCRDMLHDKVTGLQIGGDDYIIKPFDAIELLARIGAVLRRCTNWQYLASAQLTYGNLTLNLFEQTIMHGDKQVCALTVIEFRFLHYLLENAGRILSCDQILSAVWETPDTSNRNLVAVYIRRLRIKLKQIGAQPNPIESFANLGYRFALTTCDTVMSTAPKLEQYDYIPALARSVEWVESRSYGA